MSERCVVSRQVEAKGSILFWGCGAMGARESGRLEIRVQSPATPLTLYANRNPSVDLGGLKSSGCDVLRERLPRKVGSL